MSLLKIDGISKSFGGLKAVDNISFEVKEGSIHALIGPNGAGKTTLVNMISGIYTVDSGEIYFDDEKITNVPTYKLVNKKIMRTFQNLEICENMTVMENVLLGFNINMNKSLLKCSFQFESIIDDEEKFTHIALSHLKRVGLEDYAYKMCSDLSYGVLKKVEIVRALAINPKLLLLDEPVAGLNGTETAEISEIIKEIAAEGVTVLLIEHDMKMIMNISDNITVVNFGQKLAEGTPSEISSNPQVIKAYLGEGSLHA
ncbi:MAG: ABC transporter ATP-binding protein [Aliarcobacter sp.]|jgi:branched-chain amino acid transport system ATP-binding protein|nr:ABC transporter ATP-binding protein [Aliarcobacter sp.]